MGSESVSPRVQSPPSIDLKAENPIPNDERRDIESQSLSPPRASSGLEDSNETPEDFTDNSNVPQMGLLKLFWFFFFNFGLFAWGGAVAQIALLKDRLVIQDRWITIPRFQRVFSVYQILPGPEAAEICMFFGCLSAGRLGGIIAGLGFILPGFMLMLLASYLYVLVGFENLYVNASFRALQPIVAAMILRAAHKITDHTILHHQTRKVNPYLVAAAIFTAINSALRINIFISLGLYGVINTLISRRFFIAALVLFLLQYVVFAIYVVFKGIPSPVSLALGIARTPSLIHLFVLGLVAGSLSFGGAYTSIPFVQVEAVLLGMWLPQKVFIDGIAIGNVLPAPLVIFATFVGFQGGYIDGGYGKAFAGAVVITIGMFFPCFLFTIAGHEMLEKVVRNKHLAAFFDGICGSVIGVIAIIAIQLLKAGVEGPEAKKDVSGEVGRQLQRVTQAAPAAVLYVLALAALYKFTNKYTSLLIMVCGAVAGQFLFVG